MKYCKFVIMLSAGILVAPHIASATFVSKECLNYIRLMEVTIFVILLVIGLWRKPKSKFGIMFVGMGMITLFFTNDTVNGAFFCECWGGSVGLICNFGIGRSIEVILKLLIIFTIYYYLGYGLSKLYGKFINKKRVENKSSEKVNKFIKKNSDKINSKTKCNCLKNPNFWFAFVVVAVIIIFFLTIKIAEKRQDQETVKKFGEFQENKENFPLKFTSKLICSRPILSSSHEEFYRKNTTISPNLRRCAFKTSDFDNIFNFTFSPDSKRLAYTVKENDDKSFVVLDNKKSDKYGVTVSSDFTFSPDSKRFAYTIYRDYKHSIILDNQEYVREDCENIWGLTFSPDSKNFAYAIADKRNNTDIAVLNGIEGKEYAKIESFAYSPNSKHFMYKVEDKRFKDKGVFIVLDSQERSEMLDFPVFSLDGKHIAYITEENDKQLVVLDNYKNKLYEEVSNLTFSIDGEHFAYVAKENDKYFVVLDGKEGEKYSEHFAPKSYPSYSSIDNLKFSADSNFFAYTVNNGRYMRYIDKNNHSVLLHSLESGKEKKYIGGYSSLFSPNSKYFLYKSYIGNEDDFGEKRNCNIVALNDNNDEFKTVKSYVTKKFIVSNGKYVSERILNFNFKFSDDSKYIIYNEEKIVSDKSFDVYYVKELIE